MKLPIDEAKKAFDDIIQGDGFFRMSDKEYTEIANAGSTIYSTIKNYVSGE
jgi:hypothetical protein